MTDVTNDNQINDEGAEQFPQGSRSERASRQVSGYIAKVIENTLEHLRTEEQRMFYAQAMVMSANLGDLDQASPCHPNQIFRDCRFNVTYQREYGLVLSKDDAIKFLEDFCSGTIPKPSFKRKHTRDSYKQRFKRKCVIANRRQMLCTYAEWLYQHDYVFEPELPTSLIDLLPQGWKKPAGFTDEAVVAELEKIEENSAEESK